MLGWIIPDPLHIPPTRTVTPPTSTSTWAVLGRVSGVMIAPAAGSPPAGLSVSHACAVPGLIAALRRERAHSPGGRAGTPGRGGGGPAARRLRLPRGAAAP